ncbi:hypothetical protein SB748_08840 [Rhizobium sp. SIMBA_035]
MVWKIRLERSAERELSKLGADDAKPILVFLHGRLAKLDDPRSIGEALKGSELGNFWNIVSAITASSRISRMGSWRS